MSTTTGRGVSPEVEVRYLDILVRALGEKKENRSAGISLSTNEKATIYRFLRRIVARVVQQPTESDCVEMFRRRLKLLIDGDRTAWQNIRTLVQRNVREVGREKILKLDILAKHFQS